MAAMIPMTSARGKSSSAILLADNDVCDDVAFNGNVVVVNIAELCKVVARDDDDDTLYCIAVVISV